MNLPRKQLADDSRNIMTACDTLHDRLCNKYGENSHQAMYALQASIASFVCFCELDSIDDEEVPENSDAD